MDFNRICLGCMRIMPDEITATCPFCGCTKELRAERHQLQPGTILAGKYLVGRVIGETEAFITYIGLDLEKNSSIVIKELYPERSASRDSVKSTRVMHNDVAGYEKQRAGFNRRVRIWSRFRALEGLADIYSFFVENNTSYIAMEFVRSVNFEVYLEERGGKLAPDCVFEMFIPLIASLQEVHQKGFVLGNVNPGNLMVVADGKVELLLDDCVDSQGSVHFEALSSIVSKGYDPEEKYRKRGEQGPWTDVYSLCATMYRAITGIRPVEAFERLRNDTLLKPSAMGVSINLAQESVLMKGLEVRSENRIQSMLDLQNGLTQGASTKPNSNKLLKRVCNRCGKSVNEKDLFCINCGNALKPEGKKLQEEEQPLNDNDLRFVGTWDEYTFMLPKGSNSSSFKEELEKRQKQKSLDCHTKYMPVGNVVKLKKRDEKLLIIGCKVAILGEEYDYIGCVYPYGFRGIESIIPFNHEDVDGVYHEGFLDIQGSYYKHEVVEKQVPIKVFS